MTRWYVASLANGDTHLAEPVTSAHVVSACCDGRQFRPLATLHSAPVDQAQICPACRSDRPQQGSRPRSGHPAITQQGAQRRE